MLKDRQYVYIKKNMSNVNTSKTSELSLSSLINLLWEKKIIIIALSTFIFSIFFIATYLNFTFKNKDQYFVMPVHVNQKATDIDINKFLTIANVKQALEMSSIEANPINILKNLNIIKGQQNLNSLFDNLSSNDTNRLLRELSIDIDSLNKITRQVLLEIDKYYEFTLNFSRVELNETEARIFIYNLAKQINKRIIDLFPQSNMNLKTYKFLESKESTRDRIISLYYKYNLIKEAITNLQINYSNFSNETSVNDLDLMAKLVSTKIKYIIATNPNVRDLLFYNDQLEIENLNEKISAIDSLIENLSLNEAGVATAGLGQVSDDSNIVSDYSQGSFDYLLNLGSKIQLTDLKEVLILEKKDLSFEIINLMQDFDNMFSSENVTSELSILSLSEIYSETVSDLNILIDQVNVYVTKVDESVRDIAYIEAISSAYLNTDLSHQFNLWSQVINMIIMSIVFSVLFVIVNNLVFKRDDT